MKKTELLKVFQDRDQAYAHLDDFAADLRRMQITHSYGVYAAPVEKTRPRGYWGIYLRNRKVKG